MIVAGGGMVWSVSGFLHDGIESVVVVGCIMDGTNGTIWFHKGITALNHVPIAYFVLGLVVARMGVLDSVIELVLGMGLKNTHMKPIPFKNWYQVRSSRRRVRRHNALLGQHTNGNPTGPLGQPRKLLQMRKSAKKSNNY